MKSLIAITSAVLLACAGAPAIAQSAIDHRQPSAGNAQAASRFVNLRDVNLHTQAGAKEAARRIHAAASFVCTIDAPFAFGSCRNDAIDRALASLQAPLVSAALGRQAPAGLVAR